jgi:glycosyltransferase involved in cell wall biosynthesis
MASPSLRPVCMLAHSYYEEDARVRREAEALVAVGRPVDVFALRRDGDARDGVVDGVRVYRLPIQRHQGAGLSVYVREYSEFFVRAGLAALRAHRRRDYALVQVHTMPDFLALTGLPFRMTGVPVVLDMHEAMPDLFSVRFPTAAGRLPHRILRLQEDLAIRAATVVLTVNEALVDRLVRLGVPPDKIILVPNSPSLAHFDPSSQPDRPFMADGVLRLIFAGALTPIYELGVTLDALARLRALRPDLEVRYALYGRGDHESFLRDRAAELGLADRVDFPGRIPHESVSAAIAAADIGLAPTRRDRYTDLSLSTKIFEYAAMGRPIIASRLPLVERTFPPDTVRTYASGDADALAAQILDLVDRPAERKEGTRRTAELVRDRSWEREGARYVELIDGLARASHSRRR